VFNSFICPTILLLAKRVTNIDKISFVKCFLSDTLYNALRINPLVLSFVAILAVLYYIKDEQDATLAVMFISNCKITLHISDAFCVHHQEY
jgi:hypothetical protein